MKYKLTEKVILLFLAVFTVQSVKSQAIIALFFGDKITNENVSVGLYLAAQSSSISNIDNAKNGMGLSIGAYTDFKLSQKWSVTNYLSFKSPLGMKEIPLQYQVVNNAMYPEGSTIKRSLLFFELNPLMRYHITPSFSMGVGPDFGIKLKAKDYYIYEQPDGSTNTVEYKVRDYFTMCSFGFAADLQYALQQGKGLRFNVKYNQGITNIYKSEVGQNGKGSYVHFGVGIPIGGNKKQ